MLNKLFANFSSASKVAYLRIAVIIITLAAIGFSVVGNYGFSVDEGTEIAMVRRNVELITQGAPIPGDLMYFGTVFNFTAEAVFQVKEFIANGFSVKDYRTQLATKRGRLDALYERVKVKHVLTFFISLLTYISVAGIVGIFCGWDYAWFGAVALAFVPTHWGHSFFNPKDVPFAALFTFCTFTGSYLVNHYLNTNEKVKFGINRTARYSILFGILTGLLTGIRIGGLFFPFFIAIAYLVAHPSKNRIVKDFGNLVFSFILMFAAWFLTVIIEHPAAWSNPIGWFLETIGYLSKHPLRWTTLFEGKELWIQDIPRHYILKWALITIPLIFQVSLVVGIIWLLLKYSKLSNLQRACFVLVTLQIFFLPMVAIIKRSSAYDGIRHFLFMMPGIAAIAAVCLVYTYQSLTKKSLRLAAVAFIIAVFAGIGYDMVTLHPYEYIYFNRVSGGLAHAQNRFDTDYWGLSMREAMEWINKNASTNERVLVNGSVNSAQLFAAPNINIVEYNDDKVSQLTRPFYYLAWPRWGSQNKLTECSDVYRVMRHGIPLTVVRRCE